MPIYDAAMRYKADGTPLVIIAGKEYGTGSSRDWAAKGTNLLGVRAVIAETYERIHRSNLVGMGVLPLQFVDEVPEFDGTETFTIPGVAELTPRQEVAVKVTKADGTGFDLRRPVPHRYRQRARIFPARRHPPLRAAEPGARERRPDRTRHRDRDRRLDRRGPDPAAYLLLSLGQADRPVAALPGDERGRRGRLRRQRLVARRLAVGDAQRHLDADRSGGHYGRIGKARGSSTSAT